MTRVPACRAALCCGLLALLPSLALAQGSPFSFDGRRLTVRSAALEVVVEAASVVAIKDRKTGESFTAGDPLATLPLVPAGATTANDSWTFMTGWKKDPSAYSRSAQVQQGRLRPAADAKPEFRPAGPLAGELIYRGLSNAAPTDELRVRVTVEQPSGELLLQITAQVAAPPKPLTGVDLPVLNLAGSSVILGCGAEYRRADPPRVDFCVRWANNLYSPRAAVVVGQQGCLGFWSDQPGGYGNIAAAHGAETDTLLLTGERDPLQPAPGTLASDRYRLGAFPTWLEFARRYRRHFVAITKAKPLWENATPWVRQIHANLTNVPPSAEAEKYYADLAGKINPARLLLFYWNGSHILMFGDHTYAPQQPTSPQVIAALKKQGFRWMGYHPWLLMFGPKGEKDRLQELADRQWLPPGWVFNPDYDGPADKFPEAFRSGAAGYYHPLDEAQLWILHAGSTLVRKYFLRNFANYCRVHSMDGAYLDTMGCGSDWHFAEGDKLREGQAYRPAEASLLAASLAAHPELALMSETQGELTIPSSFFTWEGGSHLNLPRNHPSVETVVNHPLRTALWGSFTWNREEETDPAESALLAGLPTLDLTDDWSLARCRLFCDEELFNDLPAQWDPEALAYYRASQGRWFSFRRMRWGDAYVEQRGAQNQVRLGRFTGVKESSLPEAVTMQDWVAYRQGQPIGLNPARTYPFTLGAPPASDAVRLTTLPAGVWVNAVRPSAKHLAVELGADQPSAGEVTVVFGRACLRVCGAEKDWPGPFAVGQELKLQTPVPGGLVFVWEETPAKDSRYRSDFTAASGQLYARGTPNRPWCFNGGITSNLRKQGEVEYPTLAVGMGRYRGWSEHWVELVPEGAPVLKFSVAYDPPYNPNTGFTPAKCRLSVQANGQELWTETLPVTKAWQDREVPLAAFRGRKVLLTFCAQYDRPGDYPPTPTDGPGLFGRVSVDGNPGKLGPLDAAALPLPQEVLFRDDFAAAALNAVWTPHVSPANGAQGKIAPENGMLNVYGQHYKYAYLSRVFPAEATVVQARFQVHPSGCAAEWNPGLGLWWSPQALLFYSGGSYGADDRLCWRGFVGTSRKLAPRVFTVLDNNSLDFFLRIVLTPKQLACYSSLDGKAWVLEQEINRAGEALNAPALLLVGRGNAGEGEVFNNDERWDTGLTSGYVDDVILGRD